MLRCVPQKKEPVQFGLRLGGHVLGICVKTSEVITENMMEVEVHVVARGMSGFPTCALAVPRLV